jgi:hypothetical protein
MSKTFARRGGIAQRFASYLWYKTAVPVFLERGFIALCVTAIVVILFTNPMKFDTTQKVTACLGLLCFAYFAAHTVHLHNEASKKSAPEATAAQAKDNQTAQLSTSQPQTATTPTPSPQPTTLATTLTPTPSPTTLPTSTPPPPVSTPPQTADVVPQPATQPKPKVEIRSAFQMGDTEISVQVHNLTGETISNLMVVIEGVGWDEPVLPHTRRIQLHMIGETPPYGQAYTLNPEDRLNFCVARLDDHNNVTICGEKVGAIKKDATKYFFDIVATARDMPPVRRRMVLGFSRGAFLRPYVSFVD